MCKNCNKKKETNINKKENQIEQALDYYKLGFQFLNVSKLLLEKMIEFENTNFLISERDITEKELQEATKYSDFNIIVPVLFNYYHGLELIIKGCLANIEKLEKFTHDVEGLIKSFKDNYSADEEFRNEIIKFLENPIDLICVYKDKNKIIKGKALYESLRYPNNNLKKYDYSNLMFNNEEILEQCNEIIDNIENIKKLVVRKYKELNEF